MSVVDDPPTPALTRRSLLGGGAAAAGTLAAFAGPLAPGGLAAAASGPAPRSGARGRGAGDSALGFVAVAPNVDDAVTVPEGYVVQVLIPWGDPIQPGGPAFRFDGRNTAAEQAQQFGMAHDGMAFFPCPAAGACWW